MSALAGFRNTLSSFWRERNRRERALLLAAAAVIALGLFYMIFIDPALAGRQDLEKKLPAIRQQAAELQALSREASGLSGKAAAPAPAMTRDSIEASLARKGLKPQNVAITGELARVQLASASFAGTVEWLNEIQRTARVAVVEANIEALPPIDTVNATLTLRQQKSGQAE